MKYAFIRQHCNAHTIIALCQALGVSVSGYYDWRDRPLSATAKANQRLLTRIRCFHQASRKTYGSPRIHKDLVDSGEPVSRARVARLMRKAGIQSKMAKAIWGRGHCKHVIVHSDRGSTYASGGYQKLLNDNILVCSMSRKGECHDNAVAESFFGTLKTELTDDEDYRTQQEAKQSVFEFTEVFYNRLRRHSYLGYISPVEYERTSVL